MISQYLTFTLQDVLYAVPVAHVQEVLEYTEPEQLPCTIPYVEGLISSRGQGISVINLCKKFGLSQSPITKHTRIIVLEIKSSISGDEERITLFGAVADSVEEVFDFGAEELDSPPKFGNTISAEYIAGVGKKDDKFVIVLDVEKVFQQDESLFAKTAEEP